MKRVFFLLMSFIVMMAISLGVKAQDVTITLQPGGNWISYPHVEVVNISTALGDFVPMEGDIIKSHNASSSYINGRWRGGVTQFMPGWGYKYYSKRTEAVNIVLSAPTPQFTVTTAEPTDITTTSAVVGGTVTVPEGSHVFMRGVCWGTEPNPDIDGNHTSEETGIGSFTSPLEGLSPNTIYYVRAYALTEYGLAYGEEMNFTTAQLPSYTISVSSNPINCGIVSGGGTFQEGAYCTLIAIANDGYTFVNWTENGYHVSSDVVYSFTVTEDRTLVANFEGGDGCVITFDLYDSYGDGWSGNMLVVADDNGNTYAFTFEEGSSSSSSLMLDDGSHIALSWIVGNWMGECFFTVSYLDGDVIYEGSDLSDDFSYEFDVDCSGSLGESHEYVDLGLPSGTLWATCNVGAETPEEYGNYFAWGETQPKDAYWWNTYMYCNENYDDLTKYCNNSSYGYNNFVDNLTTLLPEDDAATINWGTGWRMPTEMEWQELYNNTTYTWTTQNGVNGLLFTASNGNSLFMPAAGYREGGSLNETGSYGGYWSSSLCTDTPYYAWAMCFYSFTDGLSDFYRYTGISVRPVRSSAQNGTSTGIIDGKFSINADGNQVYFSQGNLQYIGSASTPYWKFADNQWDYLDTQGDDRDLFGWGTSGWDNGNTHYHPWDCGNSGNSSLGFGYGPTDGTNCTYSLTGEYANADWGVYNAISNGGNEPNLWRTLTKNEWNYIINTRNTPSGIRYAMATVNGVGGTILLPDDWNPSVYTFNAPNTSSVYETNVITLDVWTTIESEGAVFLPAAGMRAGSGAYLVGREGDYWSSSCENYFEALCLHFGSNSQTGNSSIYLTNYQRYSGLSVRLVRPVQ